MDFFHISHKAIQWSLVASGLTLAWWICSAIYNLFVSPLSRFPGPKWYAVSNIPSQISLVRGNAHVDVLKLHQQYGPVVRVKPNELVFSTPQAFRDIYGARDGPEKCLPKDPGQYMAPANGVQSFAGAVDDQAHSRQRRLVSTAFSDRAMRDQEGLIRSYTDKLVGKLRNEISSQSTTETDEEKAKLAKVDIKTWMNCATFDIMSHIMFGESSFDCLEDGKLHPWIQVIFASIKAFAFVFVIYEFPLVPALLELLVPKSVKQEMENHFKFTAHRANRRLEKGSAGWDLISAMSQNGISEVPGPYKGDEKVMSRDEIHSNSSIIIMAGSETTGTLLSGTIFHLCKHPDIKQKLIHEIDSSFSQESDITFQKTAKLPYLSAVLDECLRIYPPVATSNSRLVPRGGTIIDGSYVPENTSVTCHHYASYRLASNFALPDDFIPERWLVQKNADMDSDQPRSFTNDRKDAFHPFLPGPRTCLGKVLAHSEARLIVCQLLYNFDIWLCPESVDWIEKQKVYFLWDKPGLMVNLRERVTHRT